MKWESFQNRFLLVTRQQLEVNAEMKNVEIVEWRCQSNVYLGIIGTLDELRTTIVTNAFMFRFQCRHVHIALFDMRKVVSSVATYEEQEIVMMTTTQWKAMVHGFLYRNISCVRWVFVQGCLLERWCGPQRRSWSSILKWGFVQRYVDTCRQETWVSTIAMTTYSVDFPTPIYPSSPHIVTIPQCLTHQGEIQLNGPVELTSTGESWDGQGAIHLWIQLKRSQYISKAQEWDTLTSLKKRLI